MSAWASRGSDADDALLSSGRRRSAPNLRFRRSRRRLKRRQKGARALGTPVWSSFVASASKTVAVPVDRLFDAFVDESLRERWLPDAELRERTASRPKSARFDWGDGETRVVVDFSAKEEEKSVVTLEHRRLPDAEATARMKAFWRERVSALKKVLEA